MGRVRRDGLTTHCGGRRPPRFDNLRALFLNCTLKRSPVSKNTDGLIELSSGIMCRRGVEVDLLRAVDHDIATGVWPDMTEHGWAVDGWPGIYERALPADILVLCGPIWLGDNSSVMKRFIERLYGCKGQPGPLLLGRHGPGRHLLLRSLRRYLGRVPDVEHDPARRARPR